MAENADGQEKSEEASHRRLEDARDKGQVSKSQDVTTAAILLIGGLSVFAISKSFIVDYQGFMGYVLGHSSELQITDTNVFKYYPELMLFMAKMILPVALLIFAIVMGAEIMQVGFHVATKKFSNPEEYLKIFKIGAGLKRMFFSSRSYFELIKNFVKITFLGFIIYLVVSSRFEEVVSISEKPFTEIGTFMLDVALDILIWIGVVYIIIAVADWMFQKYRYREDMKMTKQEVKEEHKQQEGNPQIKQRLRSIMRSRLRNLMMKNLPKADVVITNPTHFAVAIAYKSGNMNAPVVVAKGVDFLALKIREEATKHNIPIVEEPPLARAIYWNVDIDHEIPEELFKAVAQVLAYVYSLNQQQEV